MRESDRVLSRRAFFKRAAIITAGAAVAVAVGDEVFEALEQMFPRRLMPGADLDPLRGISSSSYPNWEPGYVNTSGGRFTKDKLALAVRRIWEQHQPMLAEAIMVPMDKYELVQSLYLPRS